MARWWHGGGTVVARWRTGGTRLETPVSSGFRRVGECLTRHAPARGAPNLKAHSADPPPCLNGLSHRFSRCFFALPHGTFQSSFLTDFGRFSAPFLGGAPLWGALWRPKGQHQRGRGPRDRLLMVLGSILGSILDPSGHHFRRFFDVFFGIPFRI